MSVERITSPLVRTADGKSFSALEVSGDGFDLVNAAEERDSSGQIYPAGSQPVISVRHDTGSTINASYIKTGVLDANLMRAGLIETVPSWNTKWYGAPEDHAAVQLGFTGGSIAVTSVSTGTGTVTLTLPAGHGLITGDYVRVSGLYFTTGTLLGGVGLNLQTDGPVDYASITVSGNNITYSKSNITSGLTASSASTVYAGKVLAVSSISRVFDDPDNPAELSTVTVTTSSAHGFSAGDYVELAGTEDTLDGVAYVTSAPTSTTFTFKQRFGDDVEFDGTTGTSLPTLGAPVAIKVTKSYTLNADGSIHITSGTVDAGLIVGTISANDITVGSGSTVARVGSYPNTTSPTFQGFWAGDSNPSSAEFSVNTAGVLNATGATISGALTATTLTATGSGSIGGWTISSTSLKAGSSGTTVGLDSGGTNPAIYAGSATPASAPFRVTNAGAVTATSGSIGGWTLGSTSLTAGSAGTTVGVDSGGTNPAFYAGSATPGSAPFRVTNAGALTATSGSIGGWTLGSTSLTAGSAGTTVGVDSGGTNPAFYAGSATPGSAPFRVTNAGALTATSGTVGGWTLGSTSLTGTNVTLSNTGVITAGTANDVAIMSAADSTYRFWAGNATATSAPFRVTKAGAVTASNISATGGSIGGWSINSTSLTSGSSSTTVGLDSGGTNPSIYAGSSTPASAPFRVSNTGAVTATNLTVTGGSISIGNFLLSTAGNITDKLVIQQKFITNENGVDLISTAATGGSAYALSKAISDGIYTGVQNGSFSAEPTTPANNLDNATNPLPYWTYSSSSSSVTAKINTDTTTGSGKKLSFTVDAGAATGANAYIERYIAIPASVARSYTFQPRVAWRSATSGATDVIGFIETQYYAADATTKTGTQGNKTVVITGAAANTPTAGTVRYTYTADSNNTIVAGDLMYVYEITSSVAGAYNLGGRVTAATSTTFDIAGTPSGTYTSGGVARQFPGFNSLSTINLGITAGFAGYESYANPNVTGNVPADGAYLRIRVGVRVISTTAASRLLEVAEIRLDRGPIQLLLTDQTDPSTYGYGGMWLSGGALTIRPNETGPGYDATASLPYAGSTGTRNPQINLYGSSGQIALNPSSTNSVVVQSKSAANGGSAAAVPLKVFGIASQTGDLQQWLDVSSNVLASIGSTGNLYLRDSIVFEGATADAFETTLQATDPTADQTITLPNATGTVQLTGQTITLGTDLSGSVTLANGAMTLNASVANDSHSHTGTTISGLTLGTDVGGSYVASLVAGTGITLANNSGSGATPTISIGQAVGTGSNVTFNNMTANGVLTANSTVSFSTPGTVTLATTTSDNVRITNVYQTTTITNSFNPRMYNASGAFPWRFFYDTSSERFKTNIVYMEDTDAILDVNPVSYHDKADYEANGEESPRQYGFLAEDMASNPEGISFVVHNGADAETIQYERLVVPLFSAMRKLRSRIEELEEQIAELKAGA